MIAGAVGLVVSACKAVDGPQERRIECGDGAQGLQIAGTRRFQVYHATCLARGWLIHTELIRTRMQAELVWPQCARNRRMYRYILFKSSHVANVVNALLELPDVARGQTDTTYIQAAQFTGDIDVLCVACRRLRFIDRNLHLPGICAID